MTDFAEVLSAAANVKICGICGRSTELSEKKLFGSHAIQRHRFDGDHDWICADCASAIMQKSEETGFLL